MINLRIAPALVALIINAGAAGAQTTTNRDSRICWQERGETVCGTRRETPDYTIDTACSADGHCTQRYRRGGPEITVDLKGEARAKHIRESTGYNDPGAINLCPAPHYRMTARDGCQPTRR